MASSACLPRARQPPVHALRLVHDDDRPRRLDQVDRLLAAGLLAVLVEVVDVLLVDGADRHHHDLDLGAGGKVAHLAELGGVVEEVVEGHAGVEALEVVLGDLERLVDALLDGDRGHHDHELGEAVAPVQLENRAQVDVGLAGAGLHLDGEVAGGERSGWRQAVADLDVVQVLQQLVVEQGQPVADAEVVLRKAEGHLAASCGIARDRELGAADLLPAEQVADRLDGLELVVEVGLEVQLHGLAPPRMSAMLCAWRSRSGSSTAAAT